MPKTPEEEVVSILVRRTGLPPERMSPETRLVQDLSLDGDDAVDALLEISKKCSMDISGFEPSLYFRSEPSLLCLLRFLPSQRKRAVPKQPLTVGELKSAAREGRLRSP